MPKPNALQAGFLNTVAVVLWLLSLAISIGLALPFALMTAPYLKDFAELVGSREDLVNSLGWLIVFANLGFWGYGISNLGPESDKSQYFKQFVVYVIRLALADLCTGVCLSLVGPTGMRLFPHANVIYVAAGVLGVSCLPYIFVGSVSINEGGALALFSGRYRTSIQASYLRTSRHLCLFIALALAGDGYYLDWYHQGWIVLICFGAGFLLCTCASFVLFLEPVPYITDTMPTLRGKILLMAAFPMVALLVSDAFWSAVLPFAWSVVCLDVVGFLLAFYLVGNILFPERLSLENWYDECVNARRGMNDPEAIVTRAFWFCLICRGELGFDICACGSRKFQGRGDGSIRCTKCGTSYSSLNCRPACSGGKHLSECDTVLFELRSKQRRRLHNKKITGVSVRCPRCLQTLEITQCPCGSREFIALTDQTIPEIQCANENCSQGRPKFEFFECRHRLYDRECGCIIRLDFAAFHLLNGKTRWLHPRLRDAFDELDTWPLNERLPGDIRPYIPPQNTGQPTERPASAFKFPEPDPSPPPATPEEPPATTFKLPEDP